MAIFAFLSPVCLPFHHTGMRSAFRPDNLTPAGRLGKEQFPLALGNLATRVGAAPKSDL
jgi:hypothetical protein